MVCAKAWWHGGEQPRIAVTSSVDWGLGHRVNRRTWGQGVVKVMLSQAKEFGLHSIGKTNSKKDSWERQNPFSQGLTLR